MNNLNSLEDQLRSWKPRRPSANLKETIFGAPFRAADELVAEPFYGFSAFWRGCYAATAAGLLFLAVIVTGSRSRSSIFPPSGAGALLATTALSNQSCIAYFTLAQVVHNAWSAQILGWTNEGAVPSTTPPLNLLHTNLLLRKL